MKYQTIIMFFIASMFLLSACQVEKPPVDQPTTIVAQDIFTDNAQIIAKTFGSEAELQAFLKHYSQNSQYYDRYSALNSAVANSEIKSGGQMTAPQARSDFSQTNNQVATVDEADILKTDGTYIYTISGSDVVIVKGYPGKDAEVVSTINLNETPSGLFIDEDKLAVFGNFYDREYAKLAGLSPQTTLSYLNVYDVSNKNNPTLVQSYKFEGYYFQARLKDDYMYLITNSYPDYRRGPILPLVIEGTTQKRLVAGDVYYYPIQYQRPVYTIVHAINLANPQNVTSKAIVSEGSQNVYMSDDNLYLSYTEYINEYEIQKEIVMDLLKDKVTAADKELIEKISNTDDDVLTRGEKDMKIMQIYSTYAQYMSDQEQRMLENESNRRLEEKLKAYPAMELTVVNKIKIDKEKISPVATAKIPGHAINQFAFDEYNGNLRIATTVNGRWSRTEGKSTESTNNVYVLDQKMEQTSKLEGIAPTERIYSTRFAGDKLYMVTFRQVDPFFVIDLSDPTNIVLQGQLKIPGFSGYLHPYDENTIIGIGKDATDEGRVQGLKISLFDVSDVNSPREIASYVSSEKYSQTTVQYDHHAFLFSRERNLLVLPAFNYNYEDPTKNFNGAFVFNVTKTSIQLRGLVTHEAANGYYWTSAVERSLYIQDLLYTKSANLLRINKLDTLVEVKNVSLSTQKIDLPVY